jgi:anti-sigma factor (TIGR02949 family)
MAVDCRDLESLVTPYVDGEVTPEQCAAIEAHLSTCPECRKCAEAESGARAVIKRCRGALRAPAPPSLHAKCRKLAAEHAGASAPLAASAADHHAQEQVAASQGLPFASSGLPSPELAARGVVDASAAGVVRGAAATAVAPRSDWRWWAPVSLAATLMLAIAGALVFGLVSGRGTALAAQLAEDHLRCLRAVVMRPPADSAEMEKRWEKNRGWYVKVPPSSSADDMQFIALRRCFHGDRQELAHALYRHKGRIVSLFIFPDDGARRANLEIMGQRELIWSQGGRSYAIVADGDAADVYALKAFFSRRL